MEVNKMGNYFEDFNVGDVLNHSLSKTIFESDNNMFCLLTMNPHPVHTNIDYATKNQHGKILVPGTLVFCLVVHLSVMDVSGKAIANLGYDSIEHLSPTYINDTLYSKSIILDKRESNNKKDRGVIYVETIGYNQNAIEVIRFKRNVLIKKSNHE
jgi:acyl dehydratase